MNEEHEEREEAPLPGVPSLLVHAALARVEDAILVMDPDGEGGSTVVHWANAAAESVLGWSAQELAGQPAAVLLGPETEPATLDRLARGLATGGEASAPVVLRRGDGRSVQVLARCLTSPDPATPGMSLAVLHPLRGLHLSPTDADSASWAEALVAGISDIVVVVGDGGAITWASPSLTARLGYAADEVLGVPVFDFVHPDELEVAAADFAETIEQGTRFSPTPYRIRHADGTWRTMNISATPMFDHPTVSGMIITGSDVTERAEIEERLRRSERWAHTLIGGSRNLVAIADGAGQISYANEAARQLGFLPEDLIGGSHLDLVHPEDREAITGAWLAALDGQEVEPGEFRLAASDGSWRVLSIVFTDMTTDPVIGGVVINAQDVTSKRRAEHLLAEQTALLEAVARGAPLEIALQKAAQMIEHVTDGARALVAMVEADGSLRTRAAPNLSRVVVDTVDRAAAHVRSLLEGTEADWLELGPEAGGFPEPLAGLQDEGVAAGRLASLRAPGSGELLGALMVLLDRVQPVEDAELTLLQRASALASIAIERRRFESTLEHQARYDPLTGLPNRTLLHSRIEDALHRSARLGRGVAVLFIDLDRFKVINDSIGHALGDELLRLVAERLRQPLRPGDTLGRFGGDEYMVVCARITDESAARSTADRFATVLAEPFELDGGTVHVTASMGIAFSSDPEELPEALIRNADVAMYRAKDSGRSQSVVFTEQIDQQKVDQLALEQALRLAIERDEFELHFQPVVDLRDGAMVHAEALVRWNRPGHGLVMPGVFIPLAEETGLIVPLGWWVLEEACQQAAAWPELPGARPFQVAINLSARQLAAPELIPTVQRVIDACELDPAQVCFEITESDLVRDVGRAVEALDRLKGLGVRIAIDDFGTGYASLDYIRHFTMADYLKIDRSFVDGVEKEGSQELAIVTAAIGMAKSLGLEVVAEGVETLFQMEALRALDCDLAQGYLFSRPVPVDAAIEVMLSSH